MRPEDLRDFTRPDTFRPFRITMNSGRTYEIGHPENIRVMRTSALVFFPGADGIPDTFETISLVLIERIVRIDAPAAKHGNGQMSA